MPALTPLTRRGEDVERPARVDARHEHRRVALARRPARPRRAAHGARWPGAAAGRTRSTRRCARPAGTPPGRRARRRVGCRRWPCRPPRRRRRPSATDRVVGGEHPERADAGQLAGVPADLGRVGHDGPDQLEIPVGGHRPDRRPAHVARPPHHHSIGHGGDPTGAADGCDGSSGIGRGPGHGRSHGRGSDGRSTRPAGRRRVPRRLLRPLRPDDDAAFYRPDRFVTHIDEGAIAAVGALYDELGPRRRRARPHVVVGLALPRGSPAVWWRSA